MSMQLGHHPQLDLENLSWLPREVVSKGAYLAVIFEAHERTV